MACETMRQPAQSLAERQAEIKQALATLTAKLTAGSVKVTIGAQGAVALTGWLGAERGGISDACAYRVLTAEGSWALRQAVARAEATSGRKVNARAVAAGVHSHDGGGSWHSGH